MARIQGSHSRPEGVTAALGANVWEVTHDDESFTPLTPDEATVILFFS